ncbi:hypothetical protein GCM10027425_27240 [Alteromonas gracilis]
MLTPSGWPAPIRLTAFTALLAAVFAAALLVGAQVAPATAPAAAEVGHQGHDGGPTASSDVPGGLQVAQDGYSLAMEETTTTAGTREVAFQVVGPDGAAVTDFEVEHDKRLHLIAVRRDLTGFQHGHPVMDAAGVWRSDLELTPGAWRLFADFVPVAADGGEAEPLTLGTDLLVGGDPGPSAPQTAPGSRVAEVDGYRVELAGDLVSGDTSDLLLSVTRGGEPVAGLETYLAARGHLVALREGDLAYLHVHPTDASALEPHQVGFAAEVPSSGGYRLYLDFQVDGVVRTAEFALSADRGTVASGSSAEGDDIGHDETGHDDTGHDDTGDDHDH